MYGNTIMHPEAIDFTYYVKSILEDFFRDKKVLDVGGGDINGNNRDLFENCEYEVNDVTDAPNVTVVARTKDLLFQDEYFDTIISTECFEHDPEYEQSFQKIVDMLRPGGLFLFTCASFGRQEHGTVRTSPRESFGTRAEIPDMSDYYKNLTERDIRRAIPLDSIFATYHIYYNAKTRDVYFLGVKESQDNVFYAFVQYHGKDVYTDLDEYTNTVKKKISFILNDDADGSLCEIRREAHELEERKAKELKERKAKKRKERKAKKLKERRAKELKERRAKELKERQAKELQERNRWRLRFQ